MSLGKMQRYLPDERQGLVYYMCRNYNNMPHEVQEQIKDVCNQVDKYNSEALLKFLITDNNKMVSIDYYVSISTLNRLRAKFFKKVADNGGQLWDKIKSG